MANKKLKTARILVSLFLAVFIFFILFRKIPPGEVLDALSRTDLKLFIAALFVSAFAALVAGVEKYRWIFRLLGLKISSKETRIFKLGSFPVKAVMPFKSGELVRAVFLKRKYGFPYNRGLLAVFANYFMRIVILFLFFLAWYFFYNGNFFSGALIFLLAAVFFIAASKIFGAGIYGVFFYSALLEICLIMNLKN